MKRRQSFGMKVFGHALGLLLLLMLQLLVDLIIGQANFWEAIALLFLAATVEPITMSPLEK